MFASFHAAPEARIGGCLLERTRVREEEGREGGIEGETQREREEREMDG